MKTKILIVVQGGVVQTVIANSADVRVCIKDFDSIRDCGEAFDPKFWPVDEVIGDPEKLNYAVWEDVPTDVPLAVIEDDEPENSGKVMLAAGAGRIIGEDFDDEDDEPGDAEQIMLQAAHQTVLDEQGDLQEVENRPARFDYDGAGRRMKCLKGAKV